jgi:hypothetical protein
MIFGHGEVREHACNFKLRTTTILLENYLPCFSLSLSIKSLVIHTSPPRPCKNVFTNLDMTRQLQLLSEEDTAVFTIVGDLVEYWLTATETNPDRF